MRVEGESAGRANSYNRSDVLIAVTQTVSVFETILVMLAAAVLLLVAARRFRLPYPVLVALAGAAVALARTDVGFHLDPQLVLALFVAPVLLDAAYDTSLRDLKRNWRAVTSLALLAVGVTTVAVAWVVHALVPDIPWAAAVALGAIVAPPDAAATVTVLRDLKLPHRIAVILEGEALLNDASALLIYRSAVAAVAAGGSVGSELFAPLFLVSIVGSMIVGPVLAWIVGKTIAGISDAPSSIILQFVSTFGVWVMAERLGLSPILTIVAYAMTLARWSPAYSPAHLRVPSYAVWDTAVLVLNVFAFLTIGLELGPVMAASRPGELAHWLGLGGAVLATVIVVRLFWALGAAFLAQWRIHKGAAPPGGGPAPNWQTGLVVGWAGTRGIVTVATALALPPTFPDRPILLFTAFIVTLGTLLLHGLTLRPLLLALNLPGDTTTDYEVAQARVATFDAALRALGDSEDEEAEIVRSELEAERRAASTGSTEERRSARLGETLRGRVLAARRERLQEMRRRGDIGDEAFHRVEEELDLAELERASRMS